MSAGRGGGRRHWQLKRLTGEQPQPPLDLQHEADANPQVWPEQSWHETPLIPQTLVLEPAWHLPLASQQPPQRLAQADEPSPAGPASPASDAGPPLELPADPSSPPASPALASGAVDGPSAP